MVGAAGMAIDYARISRVKDQIQYTADAATLFAAGAKPLGGTMADKRNTRQQLATNYLKFALSNIEDVRNPRPADGGCRRCGNQRRGQGQGPGLLPNVFSMPGRRRHTMEEGNGGTEVGLSPRAYNMTVKSKASWKRP